MSFAEAKERNYERAAAAVPNGRRRFDRILSSGPSSAFSSSPSPSQKSLKSRLLSAQNNKFEQAKILIETAKNKPNELKNLDKNRRIDLTGVDLSSLKNDVRHLPFHMVNLSKANLSGAQLEGADMRNAMLTEASLGGANLARANLGHANLDRAKLEGSAMGGAALKGSSANEANMNGVKANNISLSNAALNGAKLAAADLSGADLTNASMKGILGRNMILDGAKGDGANMSGAQIPGASIKNANLINLTLTGDLKDVDMTGTTLRNPNLDSSLHDMKVQPTIRHDAPEGSILNVAISAITANPLPQGVKPANANAPQRPQNIAAAMRKWGLEAIPTLGMI